MPHRIIQGDITTITADAIVNAACDNLAPIKVGEAVITQGFKLPAKFIIHTAGLVYKDGKSSEEEPLRSCYENSLELAVKHGCKRVAFPLLSSGIYGYPIEDTLRVAAGAIRGFISDHDIDVSLVVFDRETLAIGEKIHDRQK